MSFEQLRSFVTVAEEKTLSRAARRLHISQPPLTRRIQSLEDTVGTPLFSRTARGMTLNPAGERLLLHAKKILAAIDEAVADVQAAETQDRQRLRPSAPADAPAPPTPRMTSIAAPAARPAAFSR